MNKEEIFQIIKEYFINQFEIPAEKIVLEAHLFDDLGLDSLDALDMVSMLESEHNIVLEDEKLREVRTVEDIVNILVVAK